MDLLALLLLAGGFALLVTAHVALLFLVARRGARARIWACLLVPPLAPYWGFQERRYGWSTVWVVSALVYLASVVAATR
jgi:hypothetical protein